MIQLTDTAANPSAANFAALENATCTAGTFSTLVESDDSIRLRFPSGIAPPPAPHIEAIFVLGQTNVVFTWTSVAGRSYRVEYNSDLTPTTGPS